MRFLHYFAYFFYEIKDVTVFCDESVLLILSRPNFKQFSLIGIKLFSLRLKSTTALAPVGRALLPHLKLLRVPALMAPNTLAISWSWLSNTMLSFSFLCPALYQPFTTAEPNLYSNKSDARFCTSMKSSRKHWTTSTISASTPTLSV